MLRKSLLAILFFVALAACQRNDSPPGQSIADYETARQVFWRQLYPGQASTLYCGESIHSRQRRGVNIEHVFPMSWVSNGLGCGTRQQCRQSSVQFNRIEADLHNLFPALTRVNAARSSFRFDEVRGESRQFGQTCDFEVDARRRIAEPAPRVRGEVARAMFYMAWRYRDQGLQLFSRTGDVLYDWHLADPPSDEELRRNDKIQKLQGNRNPFIDEPARLKVLIDDGFFY